MKKKLLNVVIFFLAGLLVLSQAHAIEPGFYGDGDNSDDFIFAEVEKADRALSLRSPNEFDLGLGEIRDGVLHSIHFSLEQIRHFLNSERHKDFIVIWLEKPIMWGGPVNETIQRLEPEFRKMGYKRILFLGAHCCGVHVLKDVVVHYPYGNLLLPPVWELGAYGN